MGILQPVVGNLLHGEDSLRPVGDNLQPVGHNHQPEGDNLRPEGGSRQLVEGKRQTEVGKHQVVEGMPQTVGGSRLPEVGIQGSSFLEHEAEAGSSFKNNYGEIMILRYNVCSLLVRYLQSIYCTFIANLMHTTVIDLGTVKLKTHPVVNMHFFKMKRREEGKKNYK